MVVSKARKLRQSVSPDADIGATFWDKQLDIIESHVDDAVSKGANLLLGGKRNTKLKGLFYEPTVLEKVNNTMTIMNEETFGPIVCLQEVKSDEEALSLANNSKYGLKIDDPSEYFLPSTTKSTSYLIAKDDLFFLYSNNYNKFIKKFKHSFQHGGISIDEIIVPVGELVGKD